MVIVTHESYDSVLVGTGKQKGLESLSENREWWRSCDLERQVVPDGGTRRTIMRMTDGSAIACRRIQHAQSSTHNHIRIVVSLDPNNSFLSQARGEVVTAWPKQYGVFAASIMPTACSRRLLSLALPQKRQQATLVLRPFTPFADLLYSSTRGSI